MGTSDAEAAAPPASPGAGVQRLGLPAGPAAARTAVRRVRAALREAGWPAPVRADVALAVDEAVQNAVEHGSTPDRDVEVVIEADPRTARIVVADEGRPDARTPDGPPRPPDVDDVRGRGRVIMAALADDVRWRRRGRGTEVHLVFTNARARVDAMPDEPGRAYQERVSPPSTRSDCPVT